MPYYLGKDFSEYSKDEQINILKEELMAMSDAAYNILTKKPVYDFDSQLQKAEAITGYDPRK